MALDKSTLSMAENLKDEPANSLDEWKILINAQNLSKQGEIVRFLIITWRNTRLICHGCI